MREKFYCGYVAIVGRPNVGKSTLLNALLGKKLCITSNKPQTTRHRILAVKNEEHAQIVYVDTPGIHEQRKTVLNSQLNRVADLAIHDVDLIIFVVDVLHWNKEDNLVLEKLKEAKSPVVLVVNKVDDITDKLTLLPILEGFSKKMDFVHVVPLSALKLDNLEPLETIIRQSLPESPPFFPEDQLTDRSDKFIASEFIREKLTRLTNQELPYSITVEIEKFEKEDDKLMINAIIWVEREGQKRIVIGKKGEALKRIGQRARIDLEAFFEEHIYLKLWVKVKDDWSNNEKALQNLGYYDPS